MAMNRQQKRMLQKQGQLGADGETPTRQRKGPPPPKPPKDERTGPVQFVREVRGELRKVAWPTREEVRKYSIIVLIAVVLVTTMVALLDYAFGIGVLWLYDR